jgi:uncharacterized protein with HEPN domain
MSKGDLARIQRIKEYCEKINRSIKRFGEKFSAFESDEDYFQSVTMSIFQIGELSNGLTQAFKDDTENEIPWSDIRGIRNLFAHEYEKVDEEVVWEAINVNIPQLQQFCTNVIDKAEKGEIDYD